MILGTCWTTFVFMSRLKSRCRVENVNAFFDTSFSSTLSGDIRVHRAGSQLKIPHLARVHSTRIMQDHNQSLFSFHKVGFVKNICLTSSYYYHKLDFIQCISRTSSYYFAQSSVSEKSAWAVNHKFFRNTALWKIVRRRSADILYEVWFMKELWFTAQPDFSETLLYEKNSKTTFGRYFDCGPAWHKWAY